jgi:hypothetical protein
LKPYSAIAALLASAFLLIAGNGLVTVLTPLRAKIEGFPELTIGLLGSVYFGGMLAGRWRRLFSSGAPAISAPFRRWWRLRS